MRDLIWPHLKQCFPHVFRVKLNVHNLVCPQTQPMIAPGATALILWLLAQPLLPPLLHRWGECMCDVACLPACLSARLSDGSTDCLSG